MINMVMPTGFGQKRHGQRVDRDFVWSFLNPNFFHDLFARPRHHIDRQDSQDSPASNRNGTAADVEEPHEQPSKGK